MQKVPYAYSVKAKQNNKTIKYSLEQCNNVTINNQIYEMKGLEIPEMD